MVIIRWHWYTGLYLLLPPKLQCKTVATLTFSTKIQNQVTMPKLITSFCQQHTLNLEEKRARNSRELIIFFIYYGVLGKKKRTCVWRWYNLGQVTEDVGKLRDIILFASFWCSSYWEHFWSPRSWSHWQVRLNLYMQHCPHQYGSDTPLL